MEASTPHSNHIVAIYDTHDKAEAAIRGLKSDGYCMENLSIIGQDYQTEDKPVGFVNTGDRMMTFGKLGAFWGSIWGLLFGSAFLFVPGIGYLVLAGYVISALEGAVLGGTVGVLGGALASIGIPNNSVVQYESALKAGNFLLIAHGTEAEVQKARDLLGASFADKIDAYIAREKVVV